MPCQINTPTTTLKITATSSSSCPKRPRCQVRGSGAGRSPRRIAAAVVTASKIDHSHGRITIEASATTMPRSRCPL